MNKYLTSPVASKKLPKGIPYIIGNEAAERFSFYGMKGILVVFMTKYLHLLSDDPNLTVISKAAAIEQYHNFTYLLHHSIFQNGLIHIFMTNINLAMKQNVKCIVFSNRAKSTKSQVSNIVAFNKISIKKASLTFV